MANTGDRFLTNDHKLTGVTLPVPIGNVLDQDSDYATSTAHNYDFGGATETWFLHDVQGDDIPGGSTINGVEVKVSQYYDTSYQAARTDVAIAYDSDGSDSGAENATYSSDKTIGAANAASLQLDTYGGSSDLWGLNWDSFGGDVTNISVRFKSRPNSGTSGIWLMGYSYVFIVIHYTTDAASVNTPIRGGHIKSGVVTLSGGSVKIL